MVVPIIDPQDGLSDNQNMNKILLVYEDYPDLMTMETTLKKVGFDVIGLTNEVSVPEHILSFNPDLVIASGKGPKVSSLNVGKKLKEMARWAGKSVLILPTGVKPQTEDFLKIRMDLLLDAPLQPYRAIQVIAKLLNRDEASLLERLQQFVAGDSAPTTGSSAKSSANTPSVGEPIFVTGKVSEGTAEDGGNLLSEVLGSDATLVSDSGEKQELENENRSFKFGSKLDSVDYFGGRSAPDENSSSSLLGILDLSELEKELTGGGNYSAKESSEAKLKQLVESERSSDSSISTKASLEGTEAFREKAEESLSFDNIDLDEIAAKVKASLQVSEEKALEKKKRYQELGKLTDEAVVKKSTVTRVGARRRQKDLQKDFNEENAKDIDHLRRDFATAMFKK